MALLKTLLQSNPISTLLPSLIGKRCISTNQILDQAFVGTYMRVVDNSPLGKQAMLDGKPPKIIGIYRKPRIATLGTKVMVAIKGLKKKGVVVGLLRLQKPGVPRFDSNNMILLDDKGNPLGTRILVPIPNLLRNNRLGLNKVIAIATKFV
ncbi:39S ribosomal protein L14, mitochondrial-like [Panonychus citri]|uniref:39S ribosomal protein L14, mitochondrial-like n=1 Tax=Panonychus citri TaxID=50023 RepID=UPI00230710B0|nr:39S ribosomal protein L14, mitochondrial-like [Panonychus citri]